MSDEQFPVPKEQPIRDDIVEVPPPTQVADEYVGPTAQSEAQEQAPAVERVSVDDLIEHSEEFKGLDSSLSDPELSPEKKMELIDDFIKGPASEIARHNGVFTPKEIKALSSIQRLQKISDHFFRIFEEQEGEERSKKRAEGASRILRDVLGYAQKNPGNESPQTLIDQLKRGLEHAQVFAPRAFDSLPEKSGVESLIFALSVKETALQEEKSKQQSEAAQFESALGERPTSVESGAQKGVVQEPKPGFFSRVKESLGRIRRALSERATRFIHGDTLSINSTMASAKLDRTPREPAYPEQETPAENSAAWSGEETQEIVQPTQSLNEAFEPVESEPEAPPASPEEVPATPPVEDESEPAPAEQAEPSPSVVERVLEGGARALNTAETAETKKTPEEIAFDAAVDFTEKAEGFIKGMSALDYSKGYEAFAEKMNELLAPPSGVNPGDFALTQNRIMYRIARDESFPKEARQLLVQLLEKRGAVKVEDRGDGKKVIRRLVSYGETAKEVIRDAKTPERRAARAEFARKQEEI